MLENYQLSFAFRSKIGINGFLFEFKSFGVNLYLQWYFTVILHSDLYHSRSPSTKAACLVVAELGSLGVPAITAGQCAGREPSLFLLFYSLVMGFLQQKIRTVPIFTA